MQQWIGDLVDVGPGRFLGNRVLVPMSTAIVRTFTEEGFIIAADGRARGAEDGIKKYDDLQKIFAIGNNPRSLAYSISGAASIATCDGTEIAFDFITEINRATEALSMRRYDNLGEYARKAFGSVHLKLKDSKLAGRLDYPELGTFDPSERGSTIARVFIDGYYRDVPCRVKGRFFHECQVLAGLEVLQQELAMGAQWAQGSTKVFEMMFEGHVGHEDNLFSKYMQRSSELTSHANETLRIYAQMAYAYIDACSGPEALAIDPKPCAGIGGRIHIATITPKVGFRWLREPNNVAMSRVSQTNSTQ